MSVINKMLQDLDRREASPAEREAQAQVRPVVRETGSREWFWRTLAVLMLIALGWVAWVSYQVWPRPIATQLALQRGEEARARAALRASAPPEDAPAPHPAVAPEVPAVAVAAASAPEATPAMAATTVVPETLRMARSIETPIVEPTKRDPAAKASLKAPAKTAAAAVAAPQPAKVERRDRVVTPADLAENEFRYAAAVLKLGRSSEAESHFSRALELHPAHRGARQALVAMQIERGQLDSARRLLEGGLQIDAAQPEFAMALARIFLEGKDAAAALGALDGAAAAAAEMPEFHVLRASVLQRLGRPADAAEAYRVALRQQPAIPQAWVGLGISLEALHQRRDAATAFRQALAAGPLNADVKAYAERRIAALR